MTDEDPDESLSSVELRALALLDSRFFGFWRPNEAENGRGKAIILKAVAHLEAILVRNFQINSADGKHRDSSVGNVKHERSLVTDTHNTCNSASQPASSHNAGGGDSLSSAVACVKLEDGGMCQASADSAAPDIKPDVEMLQQQINSNNNKTTTSPCDAEEPMETGGTESVTAVETHSDQVEAVQVDMRVYCKLGHFWLLLEKYDRALSAYQIYKQRCSTYWKNASFLYGYGLALYHFNALHKATDVFLKVLYADPAFSRANEVHLRLALIYKVRRQFRLAHKRFRLVLYDSAPCTFSRHQIEFHIAHLYEVCGRLSCARRRYEALLSPAPQQQQQQQSADQPVAAELRESVCRQLGWLLHTCCQLDSNSSRRQLTAVQLLQRALELAPKASRTLYQLGRCYSSLGKVHEAFQAYKQSVVFSEANADTWCSIGVLYQQHNQCMDALQAYVSAVQLEKWHRPAWTNLAILYESVGQARDALACFVNATTDTTDTDTDTVTDTDTSSITTLTTSAVGSVSATGAVKGAISPSPPPSPSSPPTSSHQRTSTSTLDQGAVTPGLVSAGCAPAFSAAAAVTAADSEETRLRARIRLMQQQLANAPQALHSSHSRSNRLPSIEEAWNKNASTEMTREAQKLQAAILSKQRMYGGATAPPPPYPGQQQAQLNNNNNNNVKRFKVDDGSTYRSAVVGGGGNTPAFYLSQQQLQLMQQLQQLPPHQLSQQLHQQLQQLQQQYRLMVQHQRQQQQQQQQYVPAPVPPPAAAPPPAVTAQPVVSDSMDVEAMTAQLLTQKDLAASLAEDLIRQFAQSGELGLEDLVSGDTSVPAQQQAGIPAASCNGVSTSSPPVSGRNSADSECVHRAAPVQRVSRPPGLTEADLKNAATGAHHADDVKPSNDSLTTSADVKDSFTTNGVKDSTTSSSSLSIDMTAEAIVAHCRQLPAHRATNLVLLPDDAPPPLPPPPPRIRLARHQLLQPTPSVFVENKRDAFSPQLFEFCLKYPIAVVRGMAAALKMDLGVFSTRTLVEANGDHPVEVRWQVGQSSDENWDATFTRRAWGCISSRGHTTINKYAQYQAASFADSLREEQEGGSSCSGSVSGGGVSGGGVSGVGMCGGGVSRASRGSDSSDFSTTANTTTASSGAADSFGKYKSMAQRRGHKTIKFGTNVDLSDQHKWRNQLHELTRLPPFCKVASACNMLSHVGHPILGMNTVQLYMKVPGSRTPGHQENNNLCAVNINIGPGDCEWFGVPAAYWSIINTLCEKNGISYLHGSWWPDLDELLERGVPVYRFMQRPGDLVWVNAACVHWVQASGWCNNIAWNVGPLTARQHKMAIERFEWNKLQRYKSIVPMQHLTWNLARNIRPTDRELYNSIKQVLLKCLQQVVVVTEFVKQCSIDIKFHGRQKNENSHYCGVCEVEVFGMLLVKQQERRHVVHCIDCARRHAPSLAGFICLEEFTLQELTDVYDNFQLHDSVSAPAAVT